MSENIYDWSLNKFKLVRSTYGSYGAMQRYLMPHGIRGVDIAFLAEEMDYAYMGLDKIPDYILLHNLQKFLAIDCQHLY